MAKSSLAFAPLAHEATPTANVTVLHGLPKIRVASKIALTFNYAGLFDVTAVGLAFNDEVVKQAVSGRVCHQFVKLSATLGLIVPTGKAQFDSWTVGVITDIKGPFKAHGKSVAYCQALTLIRETLGLPAVTMGAWSAPKPKAPAKIKSATAPSKATISAAVTDDDGAIVTPASPIVSSAVNCAVSAIVASLDALTMAQLETLQAAIIVAMAKVAPF